MRRNMLSILTTVLAFAYLFLFNALAQAQPEIVPSPPMPPDTQGTVSGTVKLNTGQPCSNTKVLIRIGEWSTEISTNDTGVYEMRVKPGAGTVELARGIIMQPVTVRPGEVSVANFVLAPDHGVLLTVVNADGAPAKTTNLRVAYRSPNGDGTSRGINLDANHYWLPDVPASITALSAIALTGGRYATGASRQQWAFTDAQNLRALEMKLPPFGHVRLKVVDENGQPLAGQPLKCTFTYQYPPVDLFWGEDAGRRNQLTNWQTETTDAEGMLDMGLFPPQRYTLTISDGPRAGKGMSFEITPDGKVPIDSYVLPRGQRRIKQTVFDAGGTPVPNAMVTATYCWGGNVVYKHAAADAQGKVVWEDIPPTRLIVFGHDIAAGVISADATAANAPLPAPVPEEMLELRLEVETDLPAETQMRTCFRGPTFSSNIPLNLSRGMSRHSWRARVRSGSPFILILLIESDPPRAAVMTDAYLPFLDSEDRKANFPMPAFTDCAVLRGSFATPDGRPVPGVSRLELLPLDPPDWARPAQDDPFIDYLTSPSPIVQPDGSFTVTSVYPGSFRLLVDFLDAGAPDPNLDFTLNPGEETRVFTLPMPLVMVPGGTAVNYLSASAPARPRALATHAFAGAVPVFGPVEPMLACWYRLAANTLMLRTSETGWQALSLRSVRFAPKNPLFSSGMGQFRLPPPLPGENEFRFELEENYLLDLWPGRYICTRDSDDGGVVGDFTVPPDRNTEVSFRMAQERWPNTADIYSVRLHPPALEPGAKTGAARVDFDVPGKEQTIMMRDWDAGGVVLPVPRHAKTLTVTCPGVGVIAGVPLPKQDGAMPEITLPPFQPGTTLNGQIIAEAGIDLAETTLCLSDSPNGGRIYLELTPAADGTFTARNLPPGMVHLFLKDTNPRAGWAVRAPVEGDAPVKLPLSKTPVSIAVPVEAATLTALWWLPQGGPPCPLLSYGYSLEGVPAELRGRGQADHWLQSAGYDLAPGPGWLWALDTAGGKSCYLPLTLEPGLNIVRPSHDTPLSLGILFPLFPESGVPGSVTLEGLGDRTGITVTLPAFRWVPITALDVYAGQLDAVPPGAYRVTVATARGPVSGMVSVGAQGGCMRLALPRE